MSRIEYEITNPNNPRFVFHDSRGIEAGAEFYEASPLRIGYIPSFIERRAADRKIANQLHAIWYERPSRVLMMNFLSGDSRFCIPMDNPRVPSDSLELAFLTIRAGTGECSTLHSVTLLISATNSIAPVPMIAILTKYEAFIGRAKNNLKES